MTGKHGNRWSRDSIVLAIKAYVLQHGRRPSADEWKRAGPWPSYHTVVRHFGTWSDAIEASGFPRPHAGQWISSRHRKRGPYRKNKNFYKVVTIKELADRKEGESD